MNTKSYIAVALIGFLIFYFLRHGHHHLESDIIHSSDDLHFYLAESYGIHESELVFKYNPEDKPYDKQIEKMQKACREKKGAKLNLVQTDDDHIFGSYLTDTCWEGTMPESLLTPFIFSLNTTERLLYLQNKDAKVGKNQRAGFVFGKSIDIRPTADGTGIEGCFHKNNSEMGRTMMWLKSGPGKCFRIKKLEQFNVEIQELLNIKDRFEQFIDSEEYEDKEDL